MISSPFFFQSSNITQDKGILNFGSGVLFDQKTGLVTVGNEKVPVSKVVTAGNASDGKLGVNVQAVHPNAPFVILILQNYSKILILDREMYESVYIQMFFLENYDKNLFEAVELSPYSKVFKIKV